MKKKEFDYAKWELGCLKERLFEKWEIYVTGKIAKLYRPTQYEHCCECGCARGEVDKPERNITFTMKRKYTVGQIRVILFSTAVYLKKKYDTELARIREKYPRHLAASYCLSGMPTIYGECAVEARAELDKLYKIHYCNIEYVLSNSIFKEGVVK